MTCPAVIASVFQALQATGQPEAEAPAAAPVPAVPIRRVRRPGVTSSAWRTAGSRRRSSATWPPATA